MKQFIFVFAFLFIISSCNESIDPTSTKQIVEKGQGYSVERTSAGNNLHVTGTSNFGPTTYSFYDTIFIYNGGVLNLKEGNSAYIYADRYIPILTNGGKATINIGGTSGWPKLTIKRINDLGNTDINIINGTLRHDYLYSPNSSATIRNGEKISDNLIRSGSHECQGEGMIWATGNYYLTGQITFSKSVESTVIPTIRLNGGNLWMQMCSDLYTEDLITNANSVVKGYGDNKGKITVHRFAHFNHPLTQYSTIKACINAYYTPTQNKTGNATLSCSSGCN